MRPEIRDALDAARVRPARSVWEERRPLSFEHVHYLVLAVLRDVPDGMTVAELRDELEIANNQIRAGEFE